MTEMAALLVNTGFRVVRFEFLYMQRRRRDGTRRPPDRQPALLECWKTIYQTMVARFDGPVLIGGKSMGGRMATLVSDELGCAGVVCLGYPAHAPGKPEALRVTALEQTGVPTLLLQGERDPFGSREELEALRLSAAVTRCWLPDGNHDFNPRKASGLSHGDNLKAAARQVADWWRVTHE